MVEATPAPPTISRAMRPVVIVGLLIVGVFFGGLGGWASVAPLSSAAIAPGILSVESNRKTVQHLEGGLIESIYVREGEQVQAGQVLVRLDNTRAHANLEQLISRYRGAVAQEARLIAERDGSDETGFAHILTASSDNPEVVEIMSGERSIFEARQQSLRAQAAIIEQRVSQYEEEIRGLQGQIESEVTRLELIGEEIASHQALVEKKLSGTQQLMALKREQAEITGERSRHVSAIARVKQNIAEERLKILGLDTSQINEVVSELREVQTTMFDLEERIRAAEDVLMRTEIKSPLSGTIVDLQIHTDGGVITPGAPLMDIVPSNERLVIQAQVNPEDIDSVQPGLSAQVVLTAFDRRNVAPLEGKVVSVSADRLVDEQTGQPFFLARIELPDTQGANETALELYPGMQAEVMIITGQRTALEYLLRSFTRTFDRALREE